MALRLPLPDADLALDGPWRLSAETAHYATRVHRKVDGDECIAFDGKGQERSVRLSLEGDFVQVFAVGPIRTGPAGYPVDVFYGLPKGDKLDRVCRQLTELGAARLTLLSTERSIVRWPDGRRVKKRQRLERIITEAARQCGRCDAMALEGPITVQDALEKVSGEQCFVFDPTGSDTCPNLNAVQSVSIFVGPEGGFTPEELALIERSGGHRVHLGPLVLRTETAAPAALTLVLARLGHW